MRILAIDPGTHESGWCLFDYDEHDVRPSTSARSIRTDVMDNKTVLRYLADSDISSNTILAIEMVASYGMPVGAEVFETVRWIGRFEQRYRDTYDTMASNAVVRMVYRREVKSHLCGSSKAKDANIRQRLLDIFGPAGTKKAPGLLYGVKSHAWAALAVAVTAAETIDPVMLQAAA
jgi:hypothetical protein